MLGLAGARVDQKTKKLELSHDLGGGLLLKIPSSFSDELKGFSAQVWNEEFLFKVRALLGWWSDEDESRLKRTGRVRIPRSIPEPKIPSVHLETNQF